MFKNLNVSASSGAVPRFVNDGEAVVGITLEDNAYLYLKGGGPVAIVYPEDGTSVIADGMALVQARAEPGGGQGVHRLGALRAPTQKMVVQELGRRPIRKDAQPLGALKPLDQIKLVKYDIKNAADKRKEYMDKWQALVPVPLSARAVTRLTAGAAHCAAGARLAIPRDPPASVRMARVELGGSARAIRASPRSTTSSSTVEPGEFFTLLGPSGCGKTTLLRTIAGFNRQDSGEILFDGARIDDDARASAQHRHGVPGLRDLSAQERGRQRRLRPRDAPRAARRNRRSAWRARSTSCSSAGIAARMPHELSGGQQQRVALARAMVINPQILLMDEPLSNLDAKLRIELRDDIRDLQRSLGITTIYVTHDQEEALVISDRICVMQGGRVHQVAPPLEVYGRPATLFVASFVGSMNVFERPSRRTRRRRVTIGAATRALPALAGRAQITLAIRPEDVILSGPAEQCRRRDRARRRRRQGDLRRARSLLSPDGCDDGPADPGARLPARSADGSPPSASGCASALPLARLHAFDPADGRRDRSRSR